MGFDETFLTRYYSLGFLLLIMQLLKLNAELFKPDPSSLQYGEATSPQAQHQKQNMINKILAA